ncbi:repressor of RNA polymerase III transcription MAF1 homolog [Babylonia areolata]|uniref:repressor of RNA polymerase III transcription MAF1 homolog n=1 Tax=Babylonia areolata TaxID=304850 RepID=UPI003FD28E25
MEYVENRTFVSLQPDLDLDLPCSKVECILDMFWCGRYRASQRLKSKLNDCAWKTTVSKHHRHTHIKSVCCFIKALEEVFPEWDFENFSSMTEFEVGTLDSALADIKKTFSTAAQLGYRRVVDGLLNALNEEINWNDCEVMKYQPDLLVDSPFMERGCVWYLCYGFHDRVRETLVVFVYQCLNPMHCPSEEEEGFSDWDTADPRQE